MALVPPVKYINQKAWQAAYIYWNIWQKSVFKFLEFLIVWVKNFAEASPQTPSQSLYLKLFMIALTFMEKCPKMLNITIKRFNGVW